MVGIKEGDEMKLSTKGRYGLRAMIDLARYSEEEPVSIGSIAMRQGISERYLEQLVAKMKKAGLVKSIRGASGGYAAFFSEEGCMASEGCVTKYVWQRINDSINHAVDEMMLDELVKESKEMNPHGVYDHTKCTHSE